MGLRSGAEPRKENLAKCSRLLSLVWKRRVTLRQFQIAVLLRPAAGFTAVDVLSVSARTVAGRQVLVAVRAGLLADSACRLHCIVLMDLYL